MLAFLKSSSPFPASLCSNILSMYWYSSSFKNSQHANLDTLITKELYILRNGMSQWQKRSSWFSLPFQRIWKNQLFDEPRFIHFQTLILKNTRVFFSWSVLQLTGLECPCQCACMGVWNGPCQVSRVRSNFCMCILSCPVNMYFNSNKVMNQFQ